MNVPTIQYLDGGQKSGNLGGYRDPETGETVVQWVAARRGGHRLPAPDYLPRAGIGYGTQERYIAEWREHQELHRR